jgi:hypothetical protein
LAGLGGAPARVTLSPDQGWRVPAGLEGLLAVSTAAGGQPWQGRTAVVRLEPELAIAPARPAAAAPAPRADEQGDAETLGRWLVVLAALLLALDLLLSRRTPGPALPSALSPPVALSPSHGSIAPWSTAQPQSLPSDSASSARP